MTQGEPSLEETRNQIVFVGESLPDMPPEKIRWFWRQQQKALESARRGNMTGHTRSIQEHAQGLIDLSRHRQLAATDLKVQSLMTPGDFLAKSVADLNWLARNAPELLQEASDLIAAVKTLLASVGVK